LVSVRRGVRVVFCDEGKEDAEGCDWNRARVDVVRVEFVEF